MVLYRDNFWGIPNDCAIKQIIERISYFDIDILSKQGQNELITYSFNNYTIYAESAFLWETNESLCDLFIYKIE